MKTVKLAEVRRLVADLIASEGCGCCGNAAAHKVAEDQLGHLLHVPQYDDKSGYNFYKFRTKKGQK